jgi:hypothetical protein
MRQALFHQPARFKITHFFLQKPPANRKPYPGTKTQLSNTLTISNLVLCPRCHNLQKKQQLSKNTGKKPLPQKHHV